MTDDFRCAVRLARKRPGLTALALLMLALGIGATTALLSLVEAVLLRPLPFRELAIAPRWARAAGGRSGMHAHGSPPYSPHARSSAGGSGSKNAAVTRARLRMAPNWRRGGAAFTGTRRTIGVAPLAMTISSPAQARATSRERFVFAAWIECTFWVTTPVLAEDA